MSPTPVRVVVADDQTTIREALVTMLGLLPDIDVVAAAGDGEAAVAAVVEHRPDVLLTDLRMPVLDGAGATARVVAEAPETAVVLLTTFDDEDSILAALQAGARGYLTKEAGRDDIAAAIRAAAAGHSVLDPSVQTRLVQAAAGAASAAASREVPANAPHGPPESPHEGLTPREAEVLALIAEGLSNREVARRLVVSEATVKTHINHLFAKLALRDRAHAVSYAFTHGLTHT